MPMIARCNGVVLIEDGATVRVVQQGGGWLGTAVFVTGLLAVVLLANGLLIATSGSIFVGAGLIAGAVAFTAATVALLRSRRRRRAAAGGAVLAVFDFGARSLVDANAARLASLDEVRLARTFQMGSSSRALVLWVGGGRKLVVARGTPFGDSVDDVAQALVARGVPGDA